MRKRIAIPIFALILLSFLVAGCPGRDGREAAGKRIKVVVTLFPLYDFVRQIGGDRVDVSMLLPPGVEPHSFEPRPADMARIEGAGCFVFTGHAMEPWVDRLLAGVDLKRLTVIDASMGIALREGRRRTGLGEERETGGKGGHPGGWDPHIWLDFGNATTMVDTIARGLARTDPPNGAYYLSNAATFKKQLADLDERYRKSLASCRSSVLIHAGHFVFGYLADRYGLTYVSAYPGFTPDAEPTPRRLAELTDRVRSSHAKAVFYEELITPRVAEALAKETGVPLLLLSGAHNVTKKEMDGGVTFVGLMERNLENLKRGLQCP